MHRLRLTLLLLLFYLTSAAQVVGSIQPQCDVDSLGDLWIITLDKSGSMISKMKFNGERIPYTPKHIIEDVIGKFSRPGGILNRIDYSRDRILLIETGYGTKNEDCYGDSLRAAPPLDSSFIHVFAPLQKYERRNLKNALIDSLKNVKGYKYKQSFVSQIRVLSLHRLINYIRQNELGPTFRKIYIATVTDDADATDQWKLDYYYIKLDSVKMKALNEVNSKYVFSSFTQKGAGILDEIECDTTSRNHIYLYEYATRQQLTNDISFREDSLIAVSPLDGKMFDLRLNLKQIAADSICFVYIDTLTVNDIHYPIGRYMDNRMCIEQEYDMQPMQNEIVIRGKVQVQYQDSIYGAHYKSYNFVQHNKDYTSSFHTIVNNVAITIVAIVFLLLIYILFFLPNRLVMKVYSPDGNRVRIRRGYSWQWEKLVPLAFYSHNACCFAKHKCYKRSNDPVMSYDLLSGIIIDSPAPLVISKNVLSDSSKNDISANAYNSCGMYPDMVVRMYEGTLAGRLSGLRNSRFKWVRRKFHPFVNRLLFRIRPHYYYWGNAMQGLVSSPLLDTGNLLLEYNEENGKYTADDKWLNTYFEGDYPDAEVLLCTQRINNNVVWDVYHLCSHKMTGYGISSAKHLIHYLQEDADDNLMHKIRKQLEKAIRSELKVNKIFCLDSLDNGYRDKWVHFNVRQATCMAYVCLVECTVKEKCQILYSPFADTDIEEKNVVIASSTVSRLIWTSLVPFTSKRKRPSGNIAGYESLDIVREGPACQKLLSLKNRRIEFDNIIVKPQKTR